MTNIEDLNGIDCSKIDAQRVNAYLELKLDDFEQTKLVLESSWGETKVDLTPAIKLGETKTTLKLSPENLPVYLEYDGESGVPQCIHGNDLARIIPMTKLKDVSQSQTIMDGGVYMYDEEDTTFKPYDLQEFIDNTNEAIESLENRTALLENLVSQIQATINVIQSDITNLKTRVTNIETILAKPNNIPSDARIVWGNVNFYSDYTNTNNRNNGLYTHSISVDKTNDEFYA